MTKLDPIIAVKDIEISLKWYEQVFDFKKKHGGDNFSVLVSDTDEIILCLHKWEEHNHPTMTNPAIKPGNGLLLYLRTKNINAIYQNVLQAGYITEEDMHVNPNSLQKEFSIRDPDGYFLTITEFHTYDG